MPMFRGRMYYVGVERIALDASGNGTKAILFESPFYSTPSIKVVEHKSDSGSFTAASSSKTGTTLTVTGSDVVSQDIEVHYFAMEKT